jgi:hypothetical protein
MVPQPVAHIEVVVFNTTTTTTKLVVLSVRTAFRHVASISVLPLFIMCVCAAQKTQHITPGPVVSSLKENCRVKLVHSCLPHHRLDRRTKEHVSAALPVNSTWCCWWPRALSMAAAARTLLIINAAPACSAVCALKCICVCEHTQSPQCVQDAGRRWQGSRVCSAIGLGRSSVGCHSSAQPEAVQVDYLPTFQHKLLKPGHARHAVCNCRCVA